MNVSLEHYPSSYLLMIYRAGRNCYGATNACNDKIQMGVFAKRLIGRGHESVLEHVNISVYLTDVSRSFLAQITRHRLVAYSVKSQHYVKHGDFKFKELEEWGQDQWNKTLYYKLMQDINNLYKKFLDSGIPHYIAREILPNACLTDIYMTANVREWRHIIKMRITKNNTPEIQEVAEALLRRFYGNMPELFEDLVKEYL